MILAHSFPVAINTVPVAINTVPVAFNQDMRALKVSKDFLPEYLLFYLQYIKGKILSKVTTTTHGTKRLASDELYSTPVPKPSLGTQKKFVELINSHRKIKDEFIASVAASRLLKQSLINQVF
ncbi:restriction endonuclease subunit S [Leucothrix pacifica]|uniref:Type I restriction modification DNA specificity domain-containing protein n=1 Tax=Leucothrix pacifica TaxID=1247513 RepID=A0A317CL82_9GAMM|nr:restriction endonuclease subunit S [Leucothrix pacifica]PWQ99266.1 hypothetical protein DKW60_05935 [Leucothrix pacifica]